MEEIKTKVVEDTKAFKVNWKEVLSNKVTLTAFIVALVGFVYYTASLLGFDIPIAETDLIKWFGMIIGILTMLGIVTNSNTTGGGK